jgi:predicted transcriptional regulator
MANILQRAVDIVNAHASATPLSRDALLKEIQDVYLTLQALDQGKAPPPREEDKPAGPVLGLEEAFKRDQVACMICGRTGLKTLKRHLGSAHQLKPDQYRKMFDIPRELSLSAPDYVAERRQAALDRGLGEKLAAARAKRKAAAKKKAKK